jgi:hypothetical protein
MTSQPPGPRDRLIVHFTHLENLQMIMGSGLKCDSLAQAEGLLQVEVGDRGIKDMRRRLPVTAGPGGVPADYVPLYFAPRSPMLLTIADGNVAHYSDGQDRIVYLATTIGRVLDAGLAWVFSDGNCAKAITQYFDELETITTAVDWSIMKERYWANTREDGDRMRRRMAEFLVHGLVPWELFGALVVRTADTATAVRALVGEEMQVETRPGWYYEDRP